MSDGKDDSKKKTIKKKKNKIKKEANLDNTNIKHDKYIVLKVVAILIAIVLVISIIIVVRNCINNKKMNENIDGLTYKTSTGEKRQMSEAEKRCAIALNEVRRYLISDQVKIVDIAYQKVDGKEKVFIQYQNAEQNKYVLRIEEGNDIIDTKDYNGYISLQNTQEEIELQKKIIDVNNTWNSREGLTYMNVNKIKEIAEKLY